MSFKQFFTESYRIDPRMLEIEDVTDQDLFGDDIVRAWLIIQHFNNGEVQYYLSLNKEGDYFLCDMEGDEASPYYTEPFIKAVQDWDVRKQVNPSTAEKFNELIDEL